MEEPTDTKRIQKSGSPFVYISKEAAQKLKIKPGDKVIEKIDPPNRLIYEIVGVVGRRPKLRMPPLVESEP